LLPRYGGDALGLARLTLLLPSQRAIRSVTEAFVRALGEQDAVGGLLLPRMVVLGDLDLDEALGALLDPLDGPDVPPAADPTARWLRLAALIRQIEGDEAPKGAALLRRAWEAGQTMDRLAVEGIAPETLLSDEIVALVGEQAGHWRDSTRGFLKLMAHWRAELEAQGASIRPRGAICCLPMPHGRGRPRRPKSHSGCGCDQRLARSGRSAAGGERIARRRCGAARPRSDARRCGVGRIGAGGPP
jgi:hypothetical protein